MILRRELPGSECVRVVRVVYVCERSSCCLLRNSSSRVEVDVGGRGFIICTFNALTLQYEALESFDHAPLLEQFLNSQPDGTVVVAMIRNLDSLKHAGALLALHRCGSNLLERKDGLPSGSYAVVGFCASHVGTVGRTLTLAESQPTAQVKSVLKLETLLGRMFTVSPLEDLTASFVQAAEEPDPFPAARPIKPEIHAFQARQRSCRWS